jgi:LysM repeat protein
MNWSLRKFNDLQKNSKLETGTVLYLVPKKSKGSKEEHIVKDGETVYYISQAEGIKLNRLYKYNLMKKGEEPLPGESLKLQKKRISPPKLKVNSGYTASMPPFKMLPKLEKQTEKPKQDIQPQPEHVDAQVKKPEAVKNNNIELEFSGNSEIGFTVNPTTDISTTDAFLVPGGNNVVEVKTETNKVHIVKSGESLYGIAKLYSVSVADLQRWNSMADESIRPGQTLFVEKPGSLGSLSPMHIEKDIYIVGQGETLYSIAKLKGVSIDEIKELNGLEDNDLSVGQRLKIPVSSTTEYYIVQAGDTLFGISKKLNITADKLKDLNGLPDNNISIGQRLKTR